MPLIEVVFSPFPYRRAEQLVIKVINSANDSVFMAAYEFTSKPIADALCKAIERGAAVSVVLDSKANHWGTNWNTMRDRLAECHVDVKADAHYPIMHDKFIVIDGETVETGSFNFTAAAAYHNAENVIVLHEVRDIAKQFMHEWERLYSESDEN